MTNCFFDRGRIYRGPGRSLRSPNAARLVASSRTDAGSGVGIKGVDENRTLAMAKSPPAASLSVTLVKSSLEDAANSKAPPFSPTSRVIEPKDMTPLKKVAVMGSTSERSGWASRPKVNIGDGIDQHRVPMEREVVIALANSPGVLDFYVWIAWKSWVLKTGKVFIPLFAPRGPREQLGCRIHPEDRFLRRKINQWLRVIRAHWSQCPATVSPDGQSLIISSCKSCPALHHPQPVVNL